MNLYRGCKEAGLKIMEPRIVNHVEAFVYATDDPIRASIYSVKGGNLNYTNILTDDGDKLCLIERVPNCLERIFNVEGRYYVLDDSTFVKHNEMGVGEHEYVSKEVVNVIDEVVIPNMFQYYLNLEKENKLKIYRYPSRPSFIPIDDSDLIECALISGYQFNDYDKAFAFLLSFHPELEKKVNEARNFVKTHSKEDIESSFKFFK